MKRILSKLRGERSTAIPLIMWKDFHWGSFLVGLVISLILFIGGYYALAHRYKIITTSVATTRHTSFTGFTGFRPIQPPRPPQPPKPPQAPHFRTFGQMPTPATSQTIRIDTWTGRAWIYNNSSGTWQVLTNGLKNGD